MNNGSYSGVLSEDWPHLFLNGEPYPLEVGKGWHKLCAETFQKILAVYRKKRVPLNRFSVLQVKEKWGGLRIYTGQIPERVFKEVNKIIDEAENKSQTICEICGEPGRLIQDGWWMTLCEKHTEEYRSHLSSESRQATSL